MANNECGMEFWPTPPFVIHHLELIRHYGLVVRHYLVISLLPSSARLNVNSSANSNPLPAGNP